MGRIQKIAVKWLAASLKVLAVGDLVVFKGSSTRGRFWRGSADPVLRQGEYFAEDPEVALFYARNFARDGFITGFSLGGTFLDATRDPRGTLGDASGIELDTTDPRQEYTEAWEVMENIPSVVEALAKKGYTAVKFYDVAPLRGTVAYKYIGKRTIKGKPTAKVVTSNDIKRYLPVISQHLWGDPKALPTNAKGWAAAAEALYEVSYGSDLEDPEDYGSDQYPAEWSDVERIL